MEVYCVLVLVNPTVHVQSSATESMKFQPEFNNQTVRSDTQKKKAGSSKRSAIGT